MDNIFENAYFGKAYRTRGDKKVIYQKCTNDAHILFTESMITACMPNGRNTSHGHLYDIVSEWQEEINEEELDRLAYLSFPKLSTPISGEGIVDTNEEYREIFKECYREILKQKH